MSYLARKASATSVQDAFETVVESGHRLILDRIDLLQLDMTEQAKDIGRIAGSKAAGALLALSAWVALSVAAVQGLSVWLAPWAATGIVGAAYALGAVGLFLYKPKATTSVASEGPLS